MNWETIENRREYDEDETENLTKKENSCETTLAQWRGRRGEDGWVDGWKIDKEAALGRWLLAEVKNLRSSEKEATSTWRGKAKEPAQGVADGVLIL